MLQRGWLAWVGVMVGVAVGVPAPAASAATTPRMWVVNGKSLVEFEANAAGNATPVATISGPSTGLGNPTSVAVDPAGNIWALDLMGGAKIWEFRGGSTGDVAPVGELAGTKTHITEAYGIWMDPVGHLFVGNVGSAPDPDRLLEFAPGAHGDVAPIADIAGAKTKINAPGDVTTDPAGHTWLAGYDGDELQEFAQGATGNVAPLATISGTNTGLGTPFGIALDAAGHVFAANENSMKFPGTPYVITEYSAGAAGNVAPIATIAGSHTKLTLPSQLKIDASGTMFVANGDAANPILEFAAGAKGNVAPSAVIAGPHTGLSGIRALALVPPSVSTGLAGGERTTATLTGTVNPQASDTRYHFDWGSTPAYGKTTPLVDAGAGSGNRFASATVESLAPGHTYHFRLSASSDGGVRYSADRAFTVPAAAAPGMWVANQGASTVTEYAPGAFGNASPIARIAGSNTKIDGPFGVAVDGAGDIFVANNSDNSIDEFSAGANGNVAPIARIVGSGTGLGGPNGLAVGSTGRIYVANSTGTITEYARGATANASPVVTISGASTQLSGPQGLAVDASGRVSVANSGDGTVREYAANANGDAAPIATLAGASTGLLSPEAVGLNAAGYLVVGNGGGSLNEFAPGASGNTAPLVAIAGSATALNGPFGVAIDAARGLFAANFSTSAVTEYRAGATGNVTPTVTIAGPQTGLRFPGALALAAPLVVTKPATAVGTTSAALTGTVNPQGIDTHYQFQYGASTAYGRSTANVDVGHGTATETVSASISGLAPGTTYHYRLVAVSDAGTRYSLDQTFKTK